MFERYTETARRVIFFARYEAGQSGSSEIEAEHILLGLMREDANLIARFLHHPEANLESVRRKVTASSKAPGPGLADLPLSSSAKRALAFAAEEAERFKHRHIGTEHLLLGLLREEGSPAAGILGELGLRLDDLRREIANDSMGDRPATQKLSASQTPPASRDEAWLREISEAGLNLELFTEDDLIGECVRVAALRQFPPEAEALLRLLAAKGVVDLQRLPALAFDLRDEKKLAEFLERLA